MTWQNDSMHRTFDIHVSPIKSLHSINIQSNPIPIKPIIHSFFMAQSLQSPPPSPPWEVLFLVAERLDPKTLAIASCVCKFWSISMASDHLWEPIFTANFPSLSNLAVSSAVMSRHASFRRLFGLGYIAAVRRRPAPLKPTLSLSDLVFVISVSSTENDRCIVGGGAKKEEKALPQPVFTVVKHGDELAVDVDRSGLFKFDINLCEDIDDDDPVVIGARDKVEVVWNVVLEGWNGVFTMIECGGRVGLAPRADGWFSEELPAAGCCPSTVSGGVVADLKLGLCRNGDGGGEKVVVESVSVGMMSIVSWRYVSLDDGLMYLQHFLLNAIV